MRRTRAAIVAVAAATLLIGVALLYPHLCSHESNKIASVSWRAGGSPLTARVTVVDADGKPVVGADVNVDNDSGGSSAATDVQGLAVVDLGETEVTGLDVNKRRVVHRPLASYIGTPNVSSGLVIRVKLK